MERQLALDALEEAVGYHLRRHAAPYLRSAYIEAKEAKPMMVNVQDLNAKHIGKLVVVPLPRGGKVEGRLESVLHRIGEDVASWGENVRPVVDVTVASYLVEDLGRNTSIEVRS